ncbi:MAG: GNAT family N-acetyltransferase [Chloroflexi bacterium]|nr:GNAT family N-acetyltransferase [Chloroflexota bacterium]
MQPLEFNNPTHLAAIVKIWSAACGDDLAIAENFARFNLSGNTGVAQEGRVMMKDDRVIGFVLASALGMTKIGFVDAIAVQPLEQRKGIGSQLIAWAQEWLKAQGCERIRIGGSIRPFVAGLPTELKTESFFEKQSFKRISTDWDVACKLRETKGRGEIKEMRKMIGAASDEDVSAMREFFGRAFPGRWQYEFEEFMRDGGRISDYLILKIENKVEGFIQLSFEEGSYRPINRFYMSRLPHPWGQAGPLGVSKEVRGKGYGAAIIDAGLRHLKDRGVDGCVIDWTSLTDLYGKFGFEKYREYAVMMVSGK